MHLLHKTALRILLILNVYLYGQSFAGFHEIDKKTHDTYIDLDLICLPGSDISIFESIIEENFFDNPFYLAPFFLIGET